MSKLIFFDESGKEIASIPASNTQIRVVLTDTVSGSRNYKIKFLYEYDKQNKKDGNVVRGVILQ